MKRNVAIFAGLLLAILGIAATTQVDWLTNIKNKPGFEAREYNFGAQVPGGSLSATVPATITLRPVPKGLNGSDASHWVYLSGGTGTAEAVLITGGTAVAGATTGTLAFTPANSHSGSWTVSTATAGIAEAVIAAEATGGGLVSIPSGTYITHATIQPTVNGINISGAGPGNTVLTCTGGAYDCVHFDHSSQSGISDLTINASGKSAGWGINMDFSGDTLLHNLRLNSLSNGLKLYFSTIVYVDHISLRSIVGDAIYVFGGNDQTISNVLIDIDSGPNTGAGIHIEQSGGIMVSNVDAIHCNTGVLINPTIGTSSVLAAYFSQVWADSGFDGINITPVGISVPGQYTVHDVRCTDCWSASNSATGVTIGSSVSDAVFTGLEVYNNHGNGVVVGVNSTVAIRNSNIQFNSLEGSALHSDFVAANGASNFALQDSTVGGAGSFAPLTDLSAFAVLLLGNNSDYIISGNRFIPVVSGVLFDDPASTTGRVEGNVGWNPVGLSAITPGASPYTYHAGSSPEVVYVSGGTVSSINRGGGVVVASSTSTPVQASLPPHGTVIVTYTVVPSMVKDIQ